MHVDLGDWARNVDDSRAERRRAQPNVGIIGKAKALFWDSYEVPVKFVISVLIVDYGDSVVARRQVPGRRCFAFARWNLGGPVVD